MIAAIRRALARRAAREFGKLGGRARAKQQREPFRAKARLIRRELGLADDPRLRTG